MNLEWWAMVGTWVAAIAGVVSLGFAIFVAGWKVRGFMARRRERNTARETDASEMAGLVARLQKDRDALAGMFEERNEQFASETHERGRLDDEVRHLRSQLNDKEIDVGVLSASVKLALVALGDHRELVSADGFSRLGEADPFWAAGALLLNSYKLLTEADRAKTLSLMSGEARELWLAKRRRTGSKREVEGESKWLNWMLTALHQHPRYSFWGKLGSLLSRPDPAFTAALNAAITHQDDNRAAKGEESRKPSTE